MPPKGSKQPVKKKSFQQQKKRGLIGTKDNDDDPTQPTATISRPVRGNSRNSPPPGPSDAAQNLLVTGSSSRITRSSKSGLLKSYERLHQQMSLLDQAQAQAQAQALPGNPPRPSSTTTAKSPIKRVPPVSARKPFPTTHDDDNNNKNEDGRGTCISSQNPPKIRVQSATTTTTTTTTTNTAEELQDNPFHETMPAPEVWHRRMPPVFPFGETPYMARVVSDQINADLSRSEFDSNKTQIALPHPWDLPKAEKVYMERAARAARIFKNRSLVFSRGKQTYRG